MNTKNIQVRDTRNGEWHWVYNAVLADPHLTPAEKLIYASLSTFSGCEKIYPSIDVISQRANLSPRITKSAIKKLSEIGYISMESGGGRHRTNVYVLLKMPKGCKLCTVSKQCKLEQETVQITTENSANSAPQVDNNKISKKIILNNHQEFVIMFINTFKEITGLNPEDSPVNRLKYPRLIRQKIEKAGLVPSTTVKNALIWAWNMHTKNYEYYWRGKLRRLEQFYYKILPAYLETRSNQANLKELNALKMGLMNKKIVSDAEMNKIKEEVAAEERELKV